MIQSVGHAGYRKAQEGRRNCNGFDLRRKGIVNMYAYEVPDWLKLYLPVPTIVHTLVSPMSTCHNEPEEAPDSLPDPLRLDETDPAELGRRRPFGTFLVTPPALEVERFFFTRPPSFERKSEAEVGDAGALSALPCPKYSFPPDDAGVETIGDAGKVGELEPGFGLFHCRPSMGR